MVLDDPFKEASQIHEVLEKYLEKTWDGKNAILTLKEADYHWRQMEWIGFYFEFVCRKLLIANLGGTEGPSYGNTTFDYKNKYVWDFKSHISKKHSNWAILNDQEAIDKCIDEHGGIGFVIACCDAEYDDGTFQKWHDEIKGATSRYVQDRIKRGAPSRRRKVRIRITNLLMLYFKDRNEVNRAISAGWMGYFQKGMRNANGSLRRTKYKLLIGNECEDFSISLHRYF